MIQIDDKLVSDDLREAKFVCDLSACKGACCVAGDAGAPLEVDEAKLLDEIYPAVLPYLPEHAQRQLERDGRWVREDGDYETPLVDGKECVYTIFEGGVALCGIERAWKEGKISFQKPISCHLYPIRINRLKAMQLDALNYDKWSVCAPACELGSKLKVPVYKFLKSAIERKYGEEFFLKLDEVFEALNTSERK
jgi:hypothetical protein